MADIVTARAAFVRIKFTEGAANKLISNEGLETVSDLVELDLDRCRNIVARVIKPGGADAGVYVSERAMCNLAVASHLCRMWERCQRPYTMATISPGDDMETARRQMIMESKHKNDSAIIQPLSNNDLRDRNFIEYGEEVIKKLNKFRHSSGLPIGHVLRRMLIPRAHLADPAANYMTHDDEACARFRIIKEVHERLPEGELENDKGSRWVRISIECNGDVYDHLSTLWSKTRYWNHVSNTIQRNRDGRATFLAIKRNVCGPTANADLARANRAKAENAYYDGEKKQRNYGSYIAVLRHCFKVQESLADAESGKYHEFNEEEKVDFLRRGLRTPHAQVGLSTVIATPHLRENFEDAQVHIWQMIKQGISMSKLPAPSAPRQVSETKTGGKKPWEKGGGQCDLDGINAGKYDQYLNQFEYKRGRYSDEECRALHPMIRRKRYLASHHPNGARKGGYGGRGGGGRGGQGGRGGGPRKRTVAELQAELNEAKNTIKGQHEELSNMGRAKDGEKGEHSNAGNDAIVPYGHTRHQFKKT